LAVNPYPSGTRISGDISCVGVSTYTIVTDTTPTKYNIALPRVPGGNFTALSDFLLATTVTVTKTASTSYLWASNTSGLIPNATQTEDGKMYLAHCAHNIEMLPIPSKEGAGVQYIESSVPLVGGCRNSDPNVCASDSVNNAIINWWGGQGHNFWRVSCRGGVLGPLRHAEDCELTNGIWISTVTSMLDAIVQTAVHTGHSTQALLTHVEVRSVRRWWLQSIIPAATFILYIATLLYTLHLGQESGVVKELDLAEVIVAAQTDKVRVLVERGGLERSTNIGLLRTAPGGIA
jgi:hypothetical protein